MRGMKQDIEISDSSLTIPADSFLLTQQFRNFEKFREYKQQAANGEAIDTDSLVASNPEFYHTYVLAGDYLFKQKKYQHAKKYYEQALTKVIATKKEEEYINKQIKQCEQ